ncbi:Nucleolar protein 56 [Papilio machaon]|uniref:Nucleolar protein 56 n=1 Tax=Papilio machaon TaxID=76193 RepID=A0A0N0PE08_PAPMA|nr:Nucleolar protein 56 [Papilio machaon]
MMGSFSSPVPLSDIESVLAWVDTYKLSRQTKKIARDFSDAVRDKIQRDEEAHRSLKDSEQNLSSGGSYYEACGDDVKMSKLYVLYEHSAGFALFRVAEFEELAAFLPQVEESVTDLQRFNSVVTLIAFQPFKSAVVALENINAISEGIVPEDLNLFLEGALPKRKKRGKCTLGVADPKLGAAISEALEIPCSHTGAVPELIRGIRHHFHALIKGLTLKACSVTQLGLGHSYSRARVKFNVHRVDNMIIQSIALLDQLDKDINTFSMRIREWYSYHFPELVSIVPENHLYTKCAEYIKDRKSLSEESVEPLTEILGDSEKAQAIIDASKMSMGMDISPVDLINIQMFAGRVVALKTQTTIFGEKLRQQVEDRLKFYETGDIPMKNIDVMKQAMEEALQEQVIPEAEGSAKKKKKKKKAKKEEEPMDED